MVASKITTDDIRRIGRDGEIVVQLPTYAQIESVKNLVTRVKARYPREDGYTYATSVAKDTNTLTIRCFKK